MGYLEESLTPGEDVVRKAKLHWGMFVGPGFVLLVSLAAILLFMGDDSTAPIALGAAVFFLFACAGLLGRVVTYATTEFAVTNKRLVGKIGLLHRRSLELMLDKVESIVVDEPLLGRLLGYSTITVRGTGGFVQPFPYVARAMELRKDLLAHVPTMQRTG